MAANADLAKLTEIIARRICVRLSENGNKTSWLYRGIGRDRFWWARIMIGKSHFTIPDLMAIAKLLGVTPNDLLLERKQEQEKVEHLSFDEQIERRVLSILEKSKKK
jgi:hypothetical protein